MAIPNPYPGVITSQSVIASGDVYVQGNGLVNVQLTGTWVGQVFFEATPDWTNWYAALATDGNGNQANNTTVNGDWFFGCGNYIGFRARCVWTSGTLVVDLFSGVNAPPFQPVSLTTLPPQTSRVSPAANLTANGQSNGIAANGCGTATFLVSGTWVGDLQFQGSNDNVTFVAIPAVRLDTAPTLGRDIVTHTTTNGTFLVDCAGWTFVQCKFTSFTSGTATVTAVAGTGSGATYVMSQNRGRNVHAIGMASGFRCVGSAASPQNILSLENGSSSAVLLGVRDFDLYVDATVAVTATLQAKVSRITSAPTGGTTLTKVLADSSHASDASVTVRSGASADGTNSSITATAGTTLYQTLVPRPHTLAGWFSQLPLVLLPVELAPDVCLLRPGEYLLLQIVTGTGANNAATISYQSSVVWEEFTYGS